MSRKLSFTQWRRFSWHCGLSCQTSEQATNQSSPLLPGAPLPLHRGGSPLSPSLRAPSGHFSLHSWQSVNRRAALVCKSTACGTLACSVRQTNAPQDIRPTRRRLASKKADMLLSIKHNLSLINFQYWQGSRLMTWEFQSWYRRFACVRGVMDC